MGQVSHHAFILGAMTMDRLVPASASPFLSRLRRQTEMEQTSAGPPPAYEEGPHKLISDSLYSLIIFIYVSITFLYMFYAFCWRSPDPKPLTEGEKNLPMITEEITAPGEESESGGEKKEAV